MTSDTRVLTTYSIHERIKLAQTGDNDMQGYETGTSEPYVVEDHVPLPDKITRRRRSIYPFDQLQEPHSNGSGNKVYSSFYAPDERKLRTAAFQFAKKNGVQLKVVRDGEGARVFRLA